MAAYVIADVDIRNPESYASDYSRHVPATVDRYGGRFVVRGGTTEAVEGDWKPARLVVIEFDSMERARAWYNSPEYQAILPARQHNARGNIIMVEGA